MLTNTVNMSIKVAIMGDTKTGKTTFVNRLRTGNFTPNHLATLGVEVYPIEFNGLIMNMWDTAGEEKLSGLVDGHYIGAHVGLIFTTSSDTSKVQYYLDEFHRVCDNAICYLVVNKCDTDEHKDIIGDGVFNISVREDGNFDDILYAIGQGHF